MRIYVASSWRNTRQPDVILALRSVGFEVYDFRAPSKGAVGFHWSEIDPAWKSWTPEEYRTSLQHPIAVKGYETDIAALEDSDIVVLVMPCGRSAHLEFGYAIGRGHTGFILLSDGEPELMYAMADDLCTSVAELVNRCLEHQAALLRGHGT